MNITTANDFNPTSIIDLNSPEHLPKNYDSQTLTQLLLEELWASIGSQSLQVKGVASRMALEVERVCRKSSRIQSSGQIRSWQLTLGRHRLEKCLSYYRLGPKQGRVELHSNLSAIVYRYIALPQSQLGFQGRTNLIEDFLQDFYIESFKAFRRENELAQDYKPRTQLELAEYMAFIEHYAKRRITLPGGNTQQLIVLRAQAFVKRQPAETALDIEQAVEMPKGDQDQTGMQSSLMQQLRSQIVAETIDPSEGVLRDRVISELLEYLESQDQSDCVDYLVLKLQDLAAPDIDAILGITPRERDYLQQRFKYHVEKFARVSHWKLVHQWLGADIDQKLGMSSQQWETFFDRLSPQQQQLLHLKQNHKLDEEIAKALKVTPKQVQKQWMNMLEIAWKVRNSETPKPKAVGERGGCCSLSVAVGSKGKLVA
ncbi:HetZ-related protein [Argonema galeatum]|uniref:HetZ-related protein n=1 Tax=Argonema galeatum TaxID=2942762 RepID=UPI0020135A79|nr:HetZ-related protein [Argonema galeatum]MCL1468207.1 HetZ-related protein [Argonema galeatum A003/A1]